MQIGQMFVALGIELSDFSKGLQDAQQQLRKMGEDFTRTGETLTKAITLPLAAIAGLSVKAFAGFEASMNKVSALGDITGASLEKLSNQALKLGADTMFSGRQAAEAMGELAASGFKAEEIFKSMPGMLNLAAAGSLDLARATEISAGVLKGFGLAAADSQKVADILAATNAAGAASVESLGHAFQYIGPIAAASNVKLTEVSAALSILHDASVRGESAGTALRNMMSDLLKPSALAAATMKELKINVLDATGKMKSFAAVIGELKNAGLDAPEKMARGIEIFGARFSDVLPLLKTGRKGFEDLTKEIQKGADSGAAEKMAKTLQKGLTGLFEQIKGSVETLGIQIGKTLAPIVEDISRFVIKITNQLLEMAKGFETLPKSVQIAAIGLAAFTAVVGPALLVIGQLMISVSGLKLLAPALTAAGDAFASFGKMLAGADVAGSLTSVKKLYAEFSVSLLSSLKGLPAQLSSVAGGVKTALVNLSAAIVSGVKGIPAALSMTKIALIDFGIMAEQSLLAQLPKIKTAWVGLVAVFTTQSGFTAALAGASTAIQAFGASLLAITLPAAAVVAAIAALAAIGYTVYKNWNEVKGVLIGIFLDLKAAVVWALNGIGSIVESVLGKTAVGYIAAVWNGFLGIMGKVWEAIVSIYQNGLKWMVEAARKAASAIGATNTANALAEWGRKLGDTIQPAMKSVSMAAIEVKGSLKGAGDAADAAGAAIGRAAKSKKELAAESRALAKEQAVLQKEFLKIKDVLVDLPHVFSDFQKKVKEGFNAQGSINKMKEEISDIKLRFKELTPELKGYVFALTLAIAEQEKFLKASKMDDTLKKAIKASADEIKDKLVPSLKEASLAGTDVVNSLLGIEIAAAKALVPTYSLEDSFKNLGITSSETLGKAASAAEEYYAVVKKAQESEKATAYDVKMAYIAMAEAQIAAGRALGDNVAGLESSVKKVKDEMVSTGEVAVKASKKAQEALDPLWKQMSTIMTDLGKDIADAILSGKNLGEVFMNALEAMGKAVVRFAVEYVTGQLIKTVLKATSEFEVLGKTASKVFKDIIGAAAPAVSKTATSVDPSKAASAFTAPTGFLGLASTISNVVSAITDVLGYFQTRRMEKDLGRVEVNTRAIQAEITNLRNDGWLRFAIQRENFAVIEGILINSEITARLLADLLAKISTGLKVETDPKEVEELENFGKEVESTTANVRDLGTTLSNAANTVDYAFSDASESTTTFSETMDTAGEVIAASAEETAAVTKLAADRVSAAAEGLAVPVAKAAEALEKFSQTTPDWYKETSNATPQYSELDRTSGKYVAKEQPFYDSREIFDQLGIDRPSIGNTKESDIIARQKAETAARNNALTNATPWEMLTQETKEALTAGKISRDQAIADSKKSYYQLSYDAYGRVISESGEIIGEAYKDMSNQVQKGAQGLVSNMTSFSSDVAAGVSYAGQALTNSVGAVVGEMAGAFNSSIFSMESTMAEIHMLEAQLANSTYGNYEQVIAKLRNLNNTMNTFYPSVANATYGVNSGMQTISGWQVAGGESLEAAKIEHLATGQPWLMNNFYGVTDPALMADKIVSGMRIRGVDL